MGYSFPLRQAIGAAATVANALAGTPVEYLGEDVMLDIYASADIVGMTFTLNGFTGSNPGSQYLPTGSAIGLASTVGKLKTNEDFVASVAIPAGSRLVLPIVNPGGASNVNLLFVVH